MRVRELNKQRHQSKVEELQRAATNNDARKEMSQKCLEDLLRVSFEMDLAIEEGKPIPVTHLLSWLDRMNIALIVELTGRYELWLEHLNQKEAKNATDERIVEKDDAEKH
jgi:hypothetical protein